MGTLQERRAVVEQIFSDYDFGMKGYLTPIQVQTIHSDIRVGGISLAQIEASIGYVCIDETVEISELFDLLKEMDRRYFLIQDFRWEFSMLDQNQTDTITEEQARWFLKSVHGDLFSNRKWEFFLRSRAVPGSGVSFAEIEVMLCNIPSRADLLAEEEEGRREDAERARKQKELEMMIEQEKEKRKLQRDDERRLREIEDKKRRKGEDKRNKQEEEERLQRLREKQDAEERKRRLEEEEERGKKESDERELEEAQRLKDLEERNRREQEEKLRESENYESVFDSAAKDEEDAENEANKHKKRAQEAKDESSRKDAEEAAERARLRQKESRNKRIRFNLKVAINKRDRERLPPAITDFKNAKLPDDDMDLEKAEKLLREFQAADGLKKAMNSRQLAELERAINYIKRHGFEMQLAKELLEANKVLLQLRRLERIRAEILELKQATVAEIRSYQKPPIAVHTVMTATFIILGHKEKEMKEWKNVQIWVGKTGKDGLKRRCLGLDPGQIIETNAAKAQDLLSEFDLDDIRDVSAGAATFYVWSISMIEELFARLQAKKAEQEEKKKAKEAAKKKKEEELKKKKAAEEKKQMEEAAQNQETPEEAQAVAK